MNSSFKLPTFPLRKEGSLFINTKTMTGHQPTVAIDLDGTIVELHPKGVAAEVSDFKLRKGAKEGVEKLWDEGWKIIIWTAHKEPEEVADWLDDQGIPYHEINNNDDIDQQGRKIVSDVYIDDRAVNALRPWDEIVEKAKERMNHFNRTRHTIITGHSGAGKTTLAKNLSKITGHPIHHVDHDPLWKATKHISRNPNRFLTGSDEHRAFRKLLKQLIRKALNRDEPSILEGSQFLVCPGTLRGHTIIVIDGDEDTVIRQRLGRDRENGKLAIQGLETRTDKAKFLYQNQAALVEKMKQMDGVIALTPDTTYQWLRDYMKGLDMDEERGPEDLMGKTNEGLDEKGIASEVAVAAGRGVNVAARGLGRVASAAGRGISRVASGAGKVTQNMGRGVASMGRGLAGSREIAGKTPSASRGLSQAANIAHNRFRASQQRGQIRDLGTLRQGETEPRKGIEINPDGEKRVRRTYGSTASAYAHLFAGKRKQDIQKVPGKLTLFGSKRRLAGKMETQGPTVPKEMFPKKEKEERYRKKSIDEKAYRHSNINLPKLHRNILRTQANQDTQARAISGARRYRLTPKEARQAMEKVSGSERRGIRGESKTPQYMEPIGQFRQGGSHRAAKMKQEHEAQQYREAHGRKAYDSGKDQANERARNVDLIEIPEGIEGTKCGNCEFFKNGFCINSAVQQEVKENYCCNLWSAPGMKREWEVGEKRLGNIQDQPKFKVGDPITTEEGRNAKVSEVRPSEEYGHRYLIKYDDAGWDEKEERHLKSLDIEEKAYKHPHPLPKLARNAMKREINRGQTQDAVIGSRESGRTVTSQAKYNMRGRQSYRQRQRNPKPAISGPFGNPYPYRGGVTMDQVRLQRAVNQRRDQERYPRKILSAMSLNSGGALVGTSLGPKIPRREHVIQPLPEKRKMRQNTDEMEHIIHENEGGYGPSVRPVNKREGLFTRTKSYAGRFLKLPRNEDEYRRIREVGEKAYYPRIPKLERNAATDRENRMIRRSNTIQARETGRTVRSQARQGNIPSNRQLLRDPQFSGRMQDVLTEGHRGQTHRAAKMRRDVEYKGWSIPTFGQKGGSLHDAAITMGHYGGKVGGPARARVLSAGRREEIARMGGKARQRMRSV